MGMKNAEATVDDELRALETGALDPALFPHPEHVRLAYEMLGRHPFGEAVTRFSRGLRLLAAKAGRPEMSRNDYGRVSGSDRRATGPRRRRQLERIQNKQQRPSG
jgi:hypothetical protein